MKCELISAADAIRAFKGRGITVQTATPIKRPAKDIGGRRAQGDGFHARQEPLAAEHIMSAKRWSDGRVIITTIDGQKHETPRAPRSSTQEGGES